MSNMFFDEFKMYDGNLPEQLVKSYPNAKCGWVGKYKGQTYGNGYNGKLTQDVEIAFYNQIVSIIPTIIEQTK